MLHSENSAEIENNGTISAELTYIVRQKEKPYFESSHSTGGEPKVFFETEKRRTNISDMRPHVSRFSIDTNGFELINHETSVDDLYNDALNAYFDKYCDRYVILFFSIFVQIVEQVKN